MGLIPWYYKALAALLVLGAAFGAGYWRGDVHGAKELGACEADRAAAVEAVKAEGERIDAINTTLAAIAEKQQAAVSAAQDAASSARAAGRDAAARARAIPRGNCDTTASAARALAPELAKQYRSAP